MRMDSTEASRRKTNRPRAGATRSLSTKNIKPSRSSGRTQLTAKSKGAAAKRKLARRPSMTRSAKRTTDLQEIQKWAEQRGGKPVSVIGTAGRGHAGLLRIDFPGFSGKGRLEEVSWEEWFDKFNQSKLEFLYQDQDDSRFFKLVRRGSSKRASSKK